MTAFDEKYRPKTLEKLIGHEKSVTRLKGIIASKKYPNALLFVGPSSAGKTTLARAFVASLFGVDNLNQHADFHELNAADKRGIDDVRELLKVANLRPRTAPKRVFLIDEAQQLVGAAAQALLKPLENPPPHTLWILGSMEPEKLQQAIKNRCSQFVLDSPSKESMVKYVKRIAKGEEMTYMTDELVNRVAESSNGEMRSAAHIMEAITQYVAGTGSKKVKAEDVNEALSSAEGVDDQIAVKVLVAVYANKFKVVQKALLDVQDPFKMIGKLLQLNTFLMNQEVLNGEQHKSVWWSQLNKETLSGVREHGKIDTKKPLPAYAVVQQHLLDMRMQSGAFMVPETTLISAHCFQAISALKPYYVAKEK
jgi:DNA polymerase III gamma/tau subunit